MPAGGSALREADGCEQWIAEFQRRIDVESARRRGFMIASRTEAEVAVRLAAMAGWQLLPDRRWPGTRANIDLIHVGPGGVLVIDVKSWAEIDVVDGRLYRGQAEAQDELDKLAKVTELVTDATTELGLTPIEVVPVMVFMNQRGTDLSIGRIRLLDENSIVPWAIRRGNRLSPEQVAELAAMLADRFPGCDTTEPREPLALVPEPVMPLPRHARPADDRSLDLSALEQAWLESENLAPIEDWMAFLHPDQSRLVRRLSSNGPSRIRGAAGTGKTVLALHRAAYLAESTQQRVLVTSFVTTLPPVLAGLYRRLSPQTSEQVEFVSLHRWASQFLSDRGHRLQLDPRQADVCYSRAWTRYGKNSCLADLGVPWHYWRDEIDHVIKGRGLTEFGQYAELRRIGRRTRLLPAHREIVWSMYAEYDRLLRAAGIVDFTDLLSLARRELAERPLATGYAAVIVDEVQDLNCQALRLLAALANGQLLLLGDGQQQLYPGGYSLSEAGISISGRSAVLRTNYRNAADIVATAAEVVAGDGYNDLDGTNESGQRDVIAVRKHGQVWKQKLSSIDELRQQALDHVRGLLAAGRDLAGIAILCATNTEAASFQKLLANKAIPAVSLKTYEGVPVAAVKVGTYYRAKGLEFKDVLVTINPKPAARVSADLLVEQREREHRALFVAMTRARDTLWIGEVETR